MSGADITTRPPDDEPDDGRVERGGSEGAYESTTATSYGVGTVGRRHLGVRAVAPLGSYGDEPGRPDVWVPDIAVVGIAAATVLAVWSAEVVPAFVLGLVAAAVVGRRQQARFARRKHECGAGWRGIEMNCEHAGMTFRQDMESPPVRRYRTGGPA